MDKVEISQHGDFQIATAPGKGDRFFAWGKMGRIQGDCPVTEPGEHVWFTTGSTRDEARELLLDELGLGVNHGG